MPPSPLVAAAVAFCAKVFIVVFCNYACCCPFAVALAIAAVLLA